MAEPRTYARLSDDRKAIVNVELWDPDSDDLPDDLFDVTDLDPQPGIGWTRATKNKPWTPPSEPPEDPALTDARAVLAAVTDPDQPTPDQDAINQALAVVALAGQ